MSRVLVLAMVLSLSSCRSVESTFAEPDLGWQRMIAQPRFDHGELVTADPAQNGLLRAPVGVVPYQASTERNAARPPIDEALVTLGQQRFETYCATCHGRDGYAQTAVRPFMAHPPESLHSGEARAHDGKQLETLIREGKGWMPSYGAQLSHNERWAVAAWVKLMQRSQLVDEAATDGGMP